MVATAAYFGLVAFAFSVSAAPSAFKLKESIFPPRGWTKSVEAPGDQLIHLRIALPQPNFNLLEEQLYQVSDPYHERYGAHLTKEEVDALVAPHEDSINAVDEWLASHGITDVTRSAAKDWVHCEVPIKLAEKMLNTKYHVWDHADGDAIIRTTSYSLPDHMHDHIELISPTINFARLKGMKATLHYPDLEKSVDFSKTSVLANADAKYGPGAVDPSCNATITLNCLKQLYNITYTPKATKKNQIGITGYLEQYANIQDLQSFYADQLPQAVNSSFKFVSVKGGQNSQNLSESGVEAALDVQFAFGLTYPTPGTFYSTAGRPPFNPSVGTPTNTNEPYADWIDYVLSHPNPPQSISTSYGDEEQTVPLSYAKRTCAGFAQLGARGVSLMFSSGDGGVGDGNSDPADSECISNDGKNTTQFLPIFPAACPYVTSVGGTNNVPEIAVFFSGGGFSNYFPRPSYQDKAVQGYLSKLPKGLYKGLYNPAGRAIPDVAAEGRRYRIFVSGEPILIGGTSASSPTFAAVVALLNDARLAKGKPVLGFLNPLLYTKGLSGFNDITFGNNPGCGTPGFNATKGWDPITGLGTPNFGVLKDLIV